MISHIPMHNAKDSVKRRLSWTTESQETAVQVESTLQVDSFAFSQCLIIGNDGLL